MARADDTVLLIDPPEGLAAAMRTALSPWQLQVEVISDPAPDPTMPDSAMRARAICDERNATAVVWITESGSGHALWVYDWSQDNITARGLADPPPFDEPAAAAVALSIKTLLRHSEVAPKTERFGAGEMASMPAREDETARLRIEVTGGAHYSDNGADRLQLRLGVGLAVSPALADRRLELVGRLRAGPSIDVAGSDFVGHFSDTSIGAAGRVRLPLGGSLSVLPEVGASVHMTAISGTVTSSSTRASASRINPSLDGGAHLRWSLSRRIEVGVFAQLSYLARRQRYLVRGRPVLRLPEAELDVGFVLTTPLL